MFTSVNSRAASAYKRVSADTGVSTADPHQLVGMLFDALIQSLNAARGAMERGQTALKGELIGKAAAIVGGLQGSLNDNEGGALAANLDSLYDYIIRRLTQANYENSIEQLDECSRLLSEIKSAWDAIGSTI